MSNSKETISNSPKKKLTFYKASSYLCYYFVPAAILLYLIIGLLIGVSLREFMVLSGSIAFYLLAILLYLKPLAVITDNNFLEKALSYRRQIGILTFWFAVFHGIGLLFFLGILNVSTYQKIFNIYGLLFPGFIALLGMLILGFTSNHLAMAKLGHKNWKKIQMISYPTFFFVTWHYFKSGSKVASILIFSVYLLLKITQYYFHEKKERLRKDLIEYNKFQDRAD